MKLAPEYFNVVTDNKLMRFKLLEGLNLRLSFVFSRTDPQMLNLAKTCDYLSIFQIIWVGKATCTFVVA